jgi:hypothetical protein
LIIFEKKQSKYIDNSTYENIIRTIWKKEGKGVSGQKLQVTLPEKIAAELNRLTAERGLTKSVLIALAIEQYAKKGERDEDK